MAGFVRRYGYFPGSETIALIEGVVIVDLPPPGAVQGVGVGTTGIVGEFVDMSTATTVNTSGAVSTKCVPAEVTSAQDMLNKVGGFDATLGKFGAEMGSGFVAVRNKKFSRLILQAVNLASAFGTRLFRVLPTNAGALSATPAVPMQAVAVAAGTEFKSGANRVRTAKRFVFTDDAPYASAVDGSITPAGLPAATQNFVSASGDFVNRGVQVGDILVLGVIGAAGAQGTDAGTYRVTVVVSATTLTIEQMDGSNFTVGNWVTSVTPLIAWRLHDNLTADTGGNVTLANAAGYLIPARPLDAAILAAVLISPTITPPTPGATSWDPLAGLKLITHPSGALPYDATVQAPNVVNVAALDALYSTAIDAFLTQDLPARDVNIILSARSSSTINSKLKQHVLDSSSLGVGRVAVISPTLTTVAVTDAIADAAPGVGATRNERVFYSWPGATTFVPEAVNSNIAKADGSGNTTDGVVDVPGNGWLAAVCSNLPPERNPGQAASPVPGVLAPVLGLQRGVSNLSMGDYINMRAKGVAGLRIDRTVGPIFQSGVTSSLISGEKNINRRRMADFIEDSLAQRLVQFSKLPLTNATKDAMTGEVVAFLEELLSANNPSAQRIVDYEVDTKSGNTQNLEAKGIYVIISRVRSLATGDFIVAQTEVGEGVVITRAA